MSNIIRMKFDDMEEMEQLLRNSRDQLEELRNDMLTIAAQLENGVFRGLAGSTLANGLRGELSTGIVNIGEKFIEVADDIRFNIEAIKANETQVQGKFS